MFKKKLSLSSRQKKRPMPNRKQWSRFFKILTSKEKIVFIAFFLLFVSSLIFLFFNFYYNHTSIAPAKGGTQIEGVVGQPRFINPVLANSDADRDLVQLTFSGLVKYDKNLNIVPDLAEKFDVEDEGQSYIFTLKENLKWQDGEPISADDIIFTIQTIQNPEIKSPLQANWVGIEMEKMNDFTIKFILKKPYAAFLENCAVGILPKHIWQNVPAENFAFEKYNLKPVGSGMFIIKKIKEKSGQISYITLKQNPLYYREKPNIAEIKFVFFKNEEDLIKAAKENKIDGLSLMSIVNIGKDWKNYSLSLPRYFAVFFNQEQSEILKDKSVRMALNYGTDKEEIIKNVLNINGDIEKEMVDSPILPEIYGFNNPLETYEFNPEKAKSILEEAGYKENGSFREKTTVKKPTFEFKSELSKESQNKEVLELQKCLSSPPAGGPDIYPEGEISGYFGAKTEKAVIRFQEKYAEEILKPYGYTKGTGTVGKSTRAKLNQLCFESPEEILKLKFILVAVDQDQMTKVAELLKKQWGEIGVELEIQSYSLPQLERNFIKPRAYDALLFGEVLSAIPDPFPFWHSSQKKDPGLNLALYENIKADKFLEENRKAADFETRAKQLDSFQNELIKDLPAVFLYSPDFVYAVSSKIKNIGAEQITDPSKRFIGIEDWYIKTKRIWK